MASPQKWLVGLVALGCVLSSSVPVQVLAVPPEPGVAPRPTVVQTKDGLTLDWRVSMSLVQIVPRADGTLDVTLPGVSQTAQPGLPQLPFDSALIAVPPDGGSHARRTRHRRTNDPPACSWENGACATAFKRSA